MSGESDAPSTPVGGSLPSSVRLFAVLTAILATLVGFFGAGEISGLVREESAASRPVPNEVLLGLPVDAELAQVSMAAYDAAIAPLKKTRVATLSILTFTCVLASVACLRLLFPRGLARGAMRQMLVGALFCAALLRTIDGAQWAVVCRRVGLAISGELKKRGLTALGPEAAQDPQAFLAFAENLPVLMPVAVGVVTAIVSGLFLFLAQYFRSPTVREAIDAADVFAGPV